MTEAVHSSPAASDTAHPPKAYGSGLVALWIIMLLNLAWFVPYAVDAVHGILSVPPPS